ncbi:M4 family metallopeptidase [Streptomyces sp. NA02950]|uniref:M4 family metallopeptidase n=1 Tax=Streptomyces sp. NA02950 TaxID=2742137 RepID=UPI0015925AF8|nr:M4 family metallopeptidase [Streptomyces sp. NA02950]QKV90568.1 M4 family metallopeptidase [Streptomyces sp. NA02950]
MGLVGSLVTAIAINASANPDDPRGSDIRLLAYEALKSDPAQTHDARGQTFRTRAIQQDANGDRHIRMDRYYQGLPVIGGDLVLHMTKDGRLKSTSQTISSAPDLDTHPTLSAEDAWKSAFKHTPVRERATDGKGKKGLAAGPGKNSARAARDARAGSRLVVWAGKKRSQLAYENVIRGVRADGTPAEVHTYVEAENGFILGTRDRYLQEKGTGKTLFSGQVELETTPSRQGGFELKDGTRGGMTTLDAKNQCAPEDPECQSAGGGPGGGTGGPDDASGPQDPSGGGDGSGDGRNGNQGAAFGIGPLPALRAASAAYCLSGVPVCYGAGEPGRRLAGIPYSGAGTRSLGEGDDLGGDTPPEDADEDQGGQYPPQSAGDDQGGAGSASPPDGGGSTAPPPDGGDNGQGGGDNGNPLGVPGAAAVVNQDNTFGTGDDADRSTAAADVHFGASQAWDFFQKQFGRDGFGGDGRGPTLYSHYGDGVVNAFADPQNFVAVFGDGDGRNVKPLAELDVVAHEMGHLVTLSNNALSEQGEPSALNESTSDIFGTMTEFFTNNPKDPPDFTLGESLEADGRQKQLQRFMDRPSKDGNSPDCFSPGVGQLGPHSGGGVSNHFFFLLANGSGKSKFGDSPTCDNSQVKGVGNDAAEKIWFRAVTTYFTSNTGFQDARKGSVQAAADLFGKDSTEARTVAAAWNAVNVK